MYFTIILSMLAMAVAKPSFIAVPADQIAFVDLSSLHVRRVPRQTLGPPPLPKFYNPEYQPVPIPIQQYTQDQTSLALAPVAEVNAPTRLVRLQQPQDLSRAASLGPAPEPLVHQEPQIPERPPDFGEFVDFGAHTGDNGAFGWYADYPINNQEDHDHYKK